eukprot:TRINITY_DN7013_c0_g1_i2.p1 TRINITY_DN7013_c0_g1~~TRINITY_DN7013_c0_g1_i2.p1  ORF type:complete len:211 (+),score=68.77 TRINITY_DN7013_c0_g1_i2:72-704(+)
MRRGAFIVFEGIDRCGKSTQALKLNEKLSKDGIKTQAMRFPNRESKLGTIINTYLTNKEFKLEDRAIHLLFSANRWEAKDQIEELLNNGTSLIVDRYAFSGVAFSAAKGLDVDWCKNPDVGLPAPDLVIYMQLTTEEAKKRGDYGLERYENLAFQEKVKDLYEKTLKDDTWQMIDASKSVEELESIIYAIAKNTIDTVGTKPIQQLWTRS